jgi:NTP pyrophosphatase (non-canonical NTP hydrolase)
MAKKTDETTTAATNPAPATSPEMHPNARELATVVERDEVGRLAADAFAAYNVQAGGLTWDKKRLKHPEDAERLQDLGHEAADVFIYLLTICNHFGVDLETAFREKEEINKGRRW